MFLYLMCHIIRNIKLYVGALLVGKNETSELTSLAPEGHHYFLPEWQGATNTNTNSWSSRLVSHHTLGLQSPPRQFSVLGIHGKLTELCGVSVCLCIVLLLSYCCEKHSQRRQTKT